MTSKLRPNDKQVSPRFWLFFFFFFFGEGKGRGGECGGEETGMNIPTGDNNSELKDQCVRAAKKTTVRGKQAGALAWRTLWARVRAWT